MRFVFIKIHQVTIEVVDDPQAEFEMDLHKGSRNDWSLSSADWLDKKEVFWPLFWGYPDSSEDGTGRMSTEDYPVAYDSEDSVLSGVGDWDRRWPVHKGWGSKDNYGELSQTHLHADTIGDSFNVNDL